MIEQQAEYGYVLSGKEAILLKIIVWALRKSKKPIHTITADNGKEFAKHEDIAQNGY